MHWNYETPLKRYNYVYPWCKWWAWYPVHIGNEESGKVYWLEWVERKAYYDMHNNLQWIYREVDNNKGDA